MTKRSCICNRGIPASGPVAPYSKVKHCHKCWLYATDEDYNRSYGGDGIVRPIAGIKPAQKRSAKIEAMLSPPCPYRGDFTGETGTCLGCGGREKTVRFQHCSKFNEPCYVGAQSPKNGRSCMRCPVPKEAVSPAKPVFTDALRPVSRRRLALPGHFNGSMIPWENGYLLVSRTAPHNMHLTRLNADFEVVGSPRSIIANHSLAAHGGDDPRLYLLGGRPHVLFAGISTISKGAKPVARPGVQPAGLRVSQLWGELDPDTAAIQAIHATNYGGMVEKNWMPFEHDGKHLAVCSISPHRVLRLGEDGAELAHETLNLLPWSGGYLRGGAPPVPVGDEYWVWFHGADDAKRRTYNVGVCVFEAKPPFKVVRMTPNPLLWASVVERQPEGHYGCDVVFPMSAQLVDWRWTVLMGVGDTGLEVAVWDHEALKCVMA